MLSETCDFAMAVKVLTYNRNETKKGKRSTRELDTLKNRNGKDAVRTAAGFTIRPDSRSFSGRSFHATFHGINSPWATAIFQPFYTGPRNVFALQPGHQILRGRAFKGERWILIPEEGTGLSLLILLSVHCFFAFVTRLPSNLDALAAATHRPYKVRRSTRYELSSTLQNRSLDFICRFFRQEIQKSCDTGNSQYSCLVVRPSVG